MPLPQITFVSTSPEFDLATEEYRKIWDEHGKEIAASFEKLSGLPFPTHDIRAEVYEGISWSGNHEQGTPMKLRASRPYEIKKGVLIHELGHRLLPWEHYPGGARPHQVLFLILYDVYVDLFGNDFADMIVAQDHKLKRNSPKGLIDYGAVWDEALANDFATRQEKFLKYIS